MATATKTKAAVKSASAAKSNGPALIDEATKALASLAGVELIEKKGYFRVTKDGATVGYLNGSRKLRMDFAAGSSGYDAVSADDSAGVKAIVAKVKSFKAPAKPAKAAPAKKASKGKATTKKSTAKATPKAAVTATEVAPIGDDVEVTPDPK